MKNYGTLAEVEGAREAELVAECERLRGLLVIARDALREAKDEIDDVAAMPVDTSRYADALRRSDPDATADKNG